MWGVSTYFPRRKDVSIQLGSPASGDSEELEAAIANLPEEFPFNYHPQRVGILFLILAL